MGGGTRASKIEGRMTERFRDFANECVLLWAEKRIEELGRRDRCSSASTGTASTNASISTRSPPLYYGATPLVAGDDRRMNPQQLAKTTTTTTTSTTATITRTNLRPLLSLKREPELQHDVNNGPAYHSTRLTLLIEIPPSSVGRLGLEPAQFIAINTFTTTGGGTIQDKKTVSPEP
ncbi:hypothetical protein CTA2_365 [Colletotrichum tanaceti]|uniref:Uncharacterized protein n=1 Tax=Colletotrichum tanaceti TaxID=1306861 RepID=A0A4U6WZH6_9PEZI|nr:hypothetical protein CTA2_365 [Colletotrichum tanaceti]TKW48510.1 hypothetical protein CTA1_12267 [Colletotrichum tanaceti]